MIHHQAAFCPNFPEGKGPLEFPHIEVKYHNPLDDLVPHGLEDGVHRNHLPVRMKAVQPIRCCSGIQTEESLGL